MTTRFGASNERMIALKGIYDEALAKDDAELERIFNEYEKVLKEDPTNFSIRKRRVAVLKSLGRIPDAITALTVLVENSPSDVEAWAELSDLYASVGAWGQAIFCLEEVLLIMPNAWSVHAHLASHFYLSSSTSLPSLTLSLRHFARSVELNDSYLRGYYGLKFVAQKMLPLLSETTKRALSLFSTSFQQRTHRQTLALLSPLSTPHLTPEHATGILAYRSITTALITKHMTSIPVHSTYTYQGTR
ncbi:hypothetical protein GRF29_1536g151122 [Pseudopithomyces chartarum]|uniref:ER membrane protein complex subunit 2 n=1 Tax=Pseudopithomyces chartarum TaxID=1892770 RepID=A0AAN6LKJ4_9PLEO|nr:hypothetical protein GRF29_1536g151122 [Pseudopithomyces chartarum]